MYLNQYMIEGTINLDSHGCFGSVDTYPNFQEELDKFVWTIMTKKGPM